MSDYLIDHLRAEVSAAPIRRRSGRISGLSGGRILVSGLSDVAALGDQVLFAGSARSGGEIIELNDRCATVLPEAAPEGLALNQQVVLVGPAALCPDDNWIGRVIDPAGRPLDGQPLKRGPRLRPLLAGAPDAARRRELGERFDTGLSVLNTILPLVRGQRIGLFAGSGVGKSTLLARLATNVEADVVVIALVGERGRELRSFVERVLGAEGMRRAVVIAATADRSAVMRRRCAEAAMAVAEHFRDAGRQVLLLADSITRFAEAHREIALASGEAAAMRGYPPSVAQRIMALAERAGPGIGGAGDITAIFTVLVAGSDMEEPVADVLRGVLDGHIVLDRKIAERGRYPAIDVLRSVSRALPEAATEAENELIHAARGVLSTWEKSEVMVQAGLHTPGADPALDRALDIWPRLDAYFSMRADQGLAGSFAALEAALAGPEGEASAD